MTHTIAIDPGASGAIVWLDRQGTLHADNMPADYTAIVDTLRDIVTQGGECKAYLEKNSGYVPGTSGSSAAKFAMHIGDLRTALYCIGIPTEYVTPKQWQAGMNLPKDKAARKREIRTKMAALYPAIRCTLANSDALAIFNWATGRAK